MYTSGIGSTQDYDKKIIYSSALTLVYCIDDITVQAVALTQHFPLLLRL